MDREYWLYFGSNLALHLGLLAIGIAAGFAISLEWMQNAAIAQGVLPAPGTPIVYGTWRQTPLWDTATSMRSVANGAGIIGAMLILGHGVLDRYGGDLS